MREYIRHPSDIPIEVRAGDRLAHTKQQVHDISVGGLAFHSDGGLDRGMIVDVRIPFVRPVFETKARVIWCKPRDNAFELGVAFLGSDDWFRARMVEQVCHIENYKRVIQKTEGRLLTSEEAAFEWIEKYASRFPDIDPEA